MRCDMGTSHQHSRSGKQECRKGSGEYRTRSCFSCFPAFLIVFSPMPGEPQAQFLSRVREALTDRGEPVALPGDLEVSRVVPRDADLVARFLASVEQAKMIAHRVPDIPGLVRRIP